VRKRTASLLVLAAFSLVSSTAFAAASKQKAPALDTQKTHVLDTQSADLKGLRTLPDKALDVMILNYAMYLKGKKYSNVVRNDTDSGLWPLLCKSNLKNINFGLCKINSTFVHAYTFKGLDAKGLLVYEIPFENPKFPPYIIKFKVAEEDGSYCIVPSDARITSESGCYIDPWIEYPKSNEN